MGFQVIRFTSKQDFLDLTADLELNSRFDRQPMQLHPEWCDSIRIACSMNKPSRLIHTHLNFFLLIVRQVNIDRVAIVNATISTTLLNCNIFFLFNYSLLRFGFGFSRKPQDFVNFGNQ